MIEEAYGAQAYDIAIDEYEMGFLDETESDAYALYDNATKSILPFLQMKHAFSNGDADLDEAHMPLLSISDSTRRGNVGETRSTQSDHIGAAVRWLGFVFFLALGLYALTAGNPVYLVPAMAGLIIQILDLQNDQIRQPKENA